MKKYNGTAWVDTTLRQYKTATADIEPTIYTDGTAITSYTIKGNTVQDGTPTPSNPVDVVGVGTLDSGQYKIPILNGGVTTNIYLGSTQTTRQIKKYEFTGQESWGVASGAFYIASIEDYAILNLKTTACTHYQCIKNIAQITELADKQLALGRGNYRVFIKDNDYADTTEFKTFLQQQYANGTPVTIWYVLATAETGTVNEPIMKIGDYADTLSNATPIPTTEGANRITVDTTVQPSEFTATWTGWHDSSVKEYDGSDWQ